jgi:hypothetical protein
MILKHVRIIAFKVMVKTGDNKLSLIRISIKKDKLELDKTN